MTWQPGQSGNPAGRPPGTKDKRTALRELLVPHAGELVAKLVELAKAGDTTALRICIDRLIPAVKSSDVPVALPAPTGKSLADQGRAVLDALADETLTPDEATALMKALTAQARIVEIVDIEKRVDALEKLAACRNLKATAQT